LEEIEELLQKIGGLLSETKSLRTICTQIVGRMAKEADKMSQDLDAGQDARRDRAFEDLVKQYGAREAKELFDADDYPGYYAVEEANERDEEARSHLEETAFPDVPDSMDQAIESLDNLREELKALLVHFRSLK